MVVVGALNAESWTWSQPLTNGHAPPPRCGHTGTLVNKLLFVVGGVGDGPAAELGDIYVLDTEAWCWGRPEVSTPLPPLAYHAAALTADKHFYWFKQQTAASREWQEMRAYPRATWGHAFYNPCA